MDPIIKFSMIVYFAFLATFAYGADLPSFPGAEGFTHTVGGRGGRVIKVTNLNDSGPGSLREALGQNEPRIVVFEVSGVIELESTIQAWGNVTIAGETALGAGITLYAPWGKEGGIQFWDGVFGRPSTEAAPVSDYIMRFIRIRGSGKADADRLPTDSGGDTLGLVQASHVIIDHCSFAWSQDECIGIAGYHELVSLSSRNLSW